MNIRAIWNNQIKQSPPPVVVRLWLARDLFSPLHSLSPIHPSESLSDKNTGYRLLAEVMGATEFTNVLDFFLDKNGPSV